MLHKIEEIFLWVIIYSIVGWIYESIVCSIGQKRLVNRGFLNGPYTPIYGVGALFDILILGWIKNPILLFFLGAVVCCIIEYITSYLMEKLFHARWWDYSKRRFNINGRVCLLGAIVFGILSVVLLKVIHPIVSTYIGMIPQPWLHIVSSVIFVLFVTDIIVTVTGFTGFNDKLKEISLIFEQKKDIAFKSFDIYKTEANEKIKDGAGKLKENAVKIKENASRSAVFSLYENITGKLNKQQRRMIKAFPKLKSLKYDDILSDLRELLSKFKNKSD